MKKREKAEKALKRIEKMVDRLFKYDRDHVLLDTVDVHANDCLRAARQSLQVSAGIMRRDLLHEKMDPQTVWVQQ